MSQETAATASVMRRFRSSISGLPRDFLSVCTQDMGLASVVFVKYIFEGVYFFLNNPVLSAYASIVISSLWFFK
jgi:hypothetical protein